MPKVNRAVSGFSLVELLLVLAIIAIISGIAIPAFLGQRRRARVIGDAKTNASALMMALESGKAEKGVYAAAGTYNWTSSGAVPTASTNPAVSFTPKGNSQMNYALTIGSTGLTYTLKVTDPNAGGATVVTGDPSGTITLDPNYNK